MSGASASASASASAPTPAPAPVLSPEDAYALLMDYKSYKHHTCFQMNILHSLIQAVVNHINAMSRFHSLRMYEKSDWKSLLRTSWDEWATDYRAKVAPVIQRYANECRAGDRVQQLLEVSQTIWEGKYLKPRIPPKAATGDDYESEGEFPDYEPEDEEPEDD